MPRRFQERQLISTRTANEIGARFTQGGPRVVLLYPSPYRAGMSSLGYQWMLQLLQDEGYSVERAFYQMMSKRGSARVVRCSHMKPRHPFLTSL